MHQDTIPNAWSACALSEAGVIVTGNTPPKSNKGNYGGDLPFVKPPQLLNRPLNTAPESLSNAGKELSRVVPPLSVLVTCIGNLGRTAINKVPVAFNQQINAILPTEGLNSHFVWYQAQSPMFKRQLENLASATTVSIVNKEKFKSIRIVFPPIQEQERIVAKIEELFSELDAGIESLKKAQAQLITYRQSVLKHAFEGRLTNANIKDGQLPDTWSTVSLETVIEEPTYGTSKKCGYDFEGKGVLRIPNIVKGTIDPTDLKGAAFENEEIKAYELSEGDLLTIRSNGSVSIVGRCALVRKQDEDFLFAGYLIRLRPRRELILPKYLLFTLGSSDLRSQIEQKAKSTSGVNNINSKELKGLQIPLCSLYEQDQIVKEIESRLSVCDKLQESIAAGLKQSEALRQSILKKAFEGKLVK